MKSSKENMILIWLLPVSAMDYTGIYCPGIWVFPSHRPDCPFWGLPLLHSMMKTGAEFAESALTYKHAHFPLMYSCHPFLVLVIFRGNSWFFFCHDPRQTHSEDVIASYKWSSNSWFSRTRPLSMTESSHVGARSLSLKVSSYLSAVSSYLIKVPA